MRPSEEATLEEIMKDVFGMDILPTETALILVKLKEKGYNLTTIQVPEPAR